jgi:hypothetical protein
MVSQIMLVLRTLVLGWSDCAGGNSGSFSKPWSAPGGQRQFDNCTVMAARSRQLATADHTRAAIY